MAERKTEMATAHVVANVKSASPDRRAKKILAALRDDRYDFRTIEGLAKETGLEDAFIKNFLENSEEVRISAVPDKHGSVLYTLRSRPRKFQERVSELRAFMVGGTG